MSDLIQHTPYDLGVGVSLGHGKQAEVGGRCFTQHYLNQAVLIWEVFETTAPYLIITFDDVETLRILDETWLSTETDSKLWRGIDGSFARTVEGGEFPTPLDLMNDTAGPITHYQFVTGSDCVDVLARDKPVAHLVDESDLATYRIAFPQPEAPD
ncbi:MAG: hypothetical protein AAGH57_05610 [Pseudomonadota bacterium]